MEKVKILVVRPNKEPYVEEIKNSIGDIYGIVYFPFETVQIDENVSLISSIRDSTNKDFTANRIFNDRIIYSNFAIVGKKDNNFISLTAEQIKKYVDIFKMGNF